jgi:hypothetical protein
MDDDNEKTIVGMKYLQDKVDYHRAVVFAIGGVFLAAGAFLQWGLGAALMAWGLAMIVFRVSVELSPDLFAYAQGMGVIEVGKVEQDRPTFH